MGSRVSRVSRVGRVSRISRARVSRASRLVVYQTLRFMKVTVLVCFQALADTLGGNTLKHYPRSRTMRLMVRQAGEMVWAGCLPCQERHGQQHVLQE
jgi:RecA/RadA recombinase